MADIKEEMSKIEKAYKGKEIKEAILSALDKVNETNGTARYLDGHGVSEFLSQEELNEILPLDSVPTEGSNKGITSGKIYSYLVNLAEVIDDVNVVENTSGGMDETIKEKLEYLNETKRKIRKEILDHEIPITESTPLNDYQYLIGLIEMRANLDVEPLEATENKVYEAPEGHAYNPVNVNVPFNLTIKPITKNGKYKASTDGVDGYSTVNVDGGSMVVEKNITSSDFPSEIKTVTYKAKDEGDDIIGYSQVSADLSGKVLPEKPVTIAAEEAGEEYVYNAADDGVYGYGKFVLSIRETKEAFTVQFISDGEVVYAETDVPKGGSCSYKGETLEKDGYIFAGWNPQPVNIVRDTKCVAQWEQEQKETSSGMTIDEMSWDDVMSHPDRINAATSIGGGDSKYIYWMPFHVTLDGKTLYFKGGKTLAHCIYKGEHGTNTTWHMKFNFTENIDNIDKRESDVLFVTLSGGNHQGTSIASSISYGDTGLKIIANGLADAISQCSGPGYEGQNNLQFKSVRKITKEYEGVENILQDHIYTLDGLWSFSMGEIDNGDKQPEYAEANSIKYRYFGTVDLKNFPMLRTMSYWQYKATRADHLKWPDQINENDLVMQRLGLLGAGQLGDWSTSIYSYYIQGKSEDFYENFMPSLSTVRDLGKNSQIGIGYAAADMDFGFCL